MVSSFARLKLPGTCGAKAKKSGQSNKMTGLSVIIYDLQSRDINHESITHIAFEDALICFIYLVSSDDLNLRSQAVFSSEIKHLLCLPNAADKRTCNAAAAHGLRKTHCTDPVLPARRR